MKTEPCERETICNCTDEDRNWSVYTRQKIVMTKLEKAGWECTKTWQDEEGIYAKEFKAPFDCLTFRKPERKKKTLTDEQREAARIRMEEARKNRKNNKE